jgi:hypothetical protein
MIMHQDVRMMPEFSPVAVDLLKGLLCRDPVKRLGSGREGTKEIMDHEFFKFVNWEAMLRKDVAPMFVPKISDNKDNQPNLVNIDKMFTKERPTETPEESHFL